jgi:HlyD family secretion protein
MPDGNLYRQVALERLASPERLDRLMKVTDTKGWLALVGCGIVLSSVLAWGVLGSVPTKQAASGILIYSAGLADVVALDAGQVASIEVAAGEHVRAGEVVARVAQPGLEAQLAALRARQRELQFALEKSRQLASEDVQLRAATTAQARATLRSSIASTEQRMRELSERVAAQQRLYDKGLVSKETLLTTQNALRSAEAAMHGMKTDLQQLEVTQVTATRSNEVERRQTLAQVQDNEREIALLEQRLTHDSQVVSAYDGRIVEVRVLVGDVLEPGQPLISVERANTQDGLEALLYFDSRQSELVKPGMRVEISPATARRERYGVLQAEVREVADFPSTRRGMLRVLHNEQLVDAFLGELLGAPIAVRAKLRVDPSTASGYAWSSRRGASLKLSSGTRCTAAIITHNQRPISLLFPHLEALL